MFAYLPEYRNPLLALRGFLHWQPNVQKEIKTYGYKLRDDVHFAP